MLKLKKYKQPVARNAFGSNNEFHKKLEKKQEMTMKDTCSTLNIQKAFTAVIDNDATSRIMPHFEYVDKQVQAGWKANITAMDCWYTENLHKLTEHFQQSYVGMNSNFGLKSIPPRGKQLPNIDDVAKHMEESINLNRHIASEVQNVLNIGKEVLIREKEAQRIDEIRASKGSEFGNNPELTTYLGESMGGQGNPMVPEEQEDNFDKEFRTSLNGNLDISRFALRDSRDSLTEIGDDFSSKPQPKLANNVTTQRTNFVGISSAANNSTSGPGFTSTSTARTLAAQKKITKPAKNTKPIHSFFQNLKDQEGNHDSQNDDLL